LYNESLASTIGKSLQAQAQDLPAQVKFVLLIGSYLNHAYHGRLYAKAQNQRRVLQEAYDHVLRQVGVLVMPSTPMTAHRYNPNQSISERIDHGWNMLANTAPFNMTGHPSLSVPCGKTNGLPVGMMLTGAHFEDGTLLRVAHAFEEQMPWDRR
jgi:amidase